MKARLKKKWLLQGGIGSALTGFGLCCLIESGFLKYQDESPGVWISAGTLSLILTLAGINTLIGALYHKIKLDSLND